MTDFEKLYDFNNLYKAHLKARRGKQNTKEVVDFEMNLSKNLTELSESIRDKSYAITEYYEFKVYDPKIRDIHALHYRDRVFQHCLCDEVIAPRLEKKLIYDNAACRREKGTHFAMDRLTHFMSEYYREYSEHSRQKDAHIYSCNDPRSAGSRGFEGYFLKCDIRKYFENIDHDILKQKTLQGVS